MGVPLVASEIALKLNHNFNIARNQPSKMDLLIHCPTLILVGRNLLFLWFSELNNLCWLVVVFSCLKHTSLNLSVLEQPAKGIKYALQLVLKHGQLIVNMLCYILLTGIVGTRSHEEVCIISGRLFCTEGSQSIPYYAPYFSNCQSASYLSTYASDTAFSDSLIESRMLK